MGPEFDHQRDMLILQAEQRNHFLEHKKCVQDPELSGEEQNGPQCGNILFLLLLKLRQSVLNKFASIFMGETGFLQQIQNNVYCTSFTKPHQQ